MASATVTKIYAEVVRDLPPTEQLELAETIHPSRYVRGSDILDIFGQ